MAYSDINPDSLSDPRVDLVKVLGVFNWIMDHGEKQSGGEHLLDGLYACHDFDGYTLTLYDAGTRLDLFFHNRYKLDYQSREQFISFMKKIDLLFDRCCHQ